MFAQRKNFLWAIKIFVKKMSAEKNNKAKSRQGQGKVKTRLRQSQGKVRATSGQDQGKIKAKSRKGHQGKIINARSRQRKVTGRSRQVQSNIKAMLVRLRQRKHNLDLNYNLMGFDTIEINLVSVLNQLPIS